MDFTISAPIEDIRSRIAAFVEREVLPLESDPDAYDRHDNIRLDLLDGLRAKARARGAVVPAAEAGERRRRVSARSGWRCATRP